MKLTKKQKYYLLLAGVGFVAYVIITNITKEMAKDTSTKAAKHQR